MIVQGLPWAQLSRSPSETEEKKKEKEFHDVNYYLNTESIKKKKITILFALISPRSLISR